MGNFSYVTEMVNETKESFEEVKNRALNLAEDFLLFLQNVDENYKGVIVEFHEIDSDDYGNFDNPRPVVKWLVEFVVSFEIGISYKVRGYVRKHYVKLYDRETNLLIIEGLLDDVNDFILSNFNIMSPEIFNEKYCPTFYAYDMYKNEFIKNPTENQLLETIY